LNEVKLELRTQIW